MKRNPHTTAATRDPDGSRGRRCQVLGTAALAVIVAFATVATVSGTAVAGPAPVSPAATGGATDLASAGDDDCGTYFISYPLGGSVPDGTNYTIEILMNETNSSVLTYRVSARVPDGVTAISQYVLLDNPRVVAKSGFELTPDDAGEDYAWYDWDGEAERISLTYRYEVPNESAYLIAADEWGYAALTYLEHDSTWYFGDAPRKDVQVTPSTMDEFAVRAPGGTANRGGYGVTYGEPGTWTRETVTHENQTIYVSAPTSADLATPVDELARKLETDLGDADLRPGEEARTIGMVAVPSEHWIHCASGVAVGEGAAMVEASVPYGGRVGSTWLHEYVHTQQRFGSDVPYWFVEGSAEYLSYRLRVDSSATTEARVRESLLGGPDYEGSVLANRSTWESSFVAYSKGPRLLYGLDADIRQASDGERTVEDVFRRLNEMKRDSDRPSLVDAVEDVAGGTVATSYIRWTESTDSLDSLVTDTNASLFVDGVDLTGDGNVSTDPDGDGVHEDLDGDGELTIADVQLLFVMRDDDAVDGNGGLFDVNGETSGADAVTIADVQALFTELRDESP